MPRYVILEHDWPTPHWDFLIEAGDVLRAWRLLDSPANQGTIRAVANFDHRKLYLDYEGPLSDFRGHVTRWDGGTYEVIESSDASICLNLKSQRGERNVRLARQESEWRFDWEAA